MDSDGESVGPAAGVRLGLAPAGYWQAIVRWAHRWQEGMAWSQRRRALVQARQDLRRGGGLSRSREVFVWVMMRSQERWRVEMWKEVSGEVEEEDVE